MSIQPRGDGLTLPDSVGEVRRFELECAAVAEGREDARDGTDVQPAGEAELDPGQR